ncbi:uncharacterized protein LOC127735771 isoform X2 [Mytilus californianus]|uniref:uncharacterized protein LOC127735771 isoform X2 n=1 Tax=Mytilus californianus TaxID=6549 RepID=UPI0022481391|nr:uncharacterized protein LOC127735771 isoform X2 [Mytilus californianus]
MSARTSFRPWEYRKIDEALLQLALNFPNYDKKSDTVTVTDKQHPISSMSDRVSDSDGEVVVNVKSKVCCNCKEMFDSRKQLINHEKLCGQEIEASVGCPNCQKSFSRTDNMKRHWRLKHGGEEKEKPSPSKTCKISSMHGRSLSADSGCAKSKTKVSSQRKEPLTKKSEIGTEPGISSSISSLKKEERAGVTNIIRKKQRESMTQKSDKKNTSVRARSLSPTKCSSQKSKIQFDKGLKIRNKTLPVDNIHLKFEFEPAKTQSDENCISTSTKKVHSRSRTLSSGRPQQLSDKCDGSESKILSVENTLGNKSYQCRSKTLTEDCGLKLSDKHARSRSKTPSGDKSNRSRCKTPSGDKSNRSRCKTPSGDSVLQSSDKSNRSKSATSKNETPSAPRNFPTYDSANLKVITPTENSASTRNKMTSHARSPASGSVTSNSKISIYVDEAGDRKISPGKKETSKQNILSPIKAVITKKTAKHHDGMTSPGKREMDKQTPKQNVDITSPKRKTIKPMLKVEVSTPSGHVSKMTFNCKLCPKSFTTRMGYRQHCKRSHKIDVDLNDSMNEKLEITQSPDIKQEYITSKSGKKRKKPIPGICKVCGEISTGKHYGVESCRSCNDFFYKRYIKEKNLDNGLQCYLEKTCVMDRNNRHSCDYCRLQKCLAVGMSKQGNLRTTAGIKNRLRKTKSLINFFQCHLCGVRFLSKDSMNKHNERKHFGQNRDLKCNLCGKQYILKTSLWQHCLTVHKGKNLSDKWTKVEAIEQNEQLELPGNINWILAQNPNQCIDVQENLIDTKVDFKKILPTELPQKVVRKSMHNLKMNKTNDKQHENMETEKEVMCNKPTGLFSTSTTEASTNRRVRTKKLKSVQKVLSVKTKTKKGILKSKKLKKNKFKKLQNHKQLTVMSKYELRNKLLSEVKLKGKIKSIKKPSEGIPKTLSESLEGIPKTLSESLAGKPKTLSESKLEPSERKPHNSLKENIMLKDVKILVKKFVPLPPVIDKSERQNETISNNFDQNGEKGELPQLTGKIDKISDKVSVLIDSNKDTIDKEEDEKTLKNMSLLLSGTHKDSLHERLIIPYSEKSPQGRIDNKYKGLKITLPSSGEGRIVRNEENLEGTEFEKSHKVLKNQKDFVNFKITLQTRSECRTVMSANKSSVGNRSEAKGLDGSDKTKENNIIQEKSLLESETENETENHNCPTDKNAKETESTVGTEQDLSNNTSNSVQEPEKLAEKSKIKTSKRSRLESHIMEPLGTKPSEVEPVKLLGKTCISINSPKALREQQEHSKTLNNKNLDNLKAVDKKSKISRASLTRRFERAHMHSEHQDHDDNTLDSSEVDEQLEQKQNTVSQKDDIQKDARQQYNKSKRRSPKVLLEKLSISESEQTVNISSMPLLKDRYTRVTEIENVCASGRNLDPLFGVKSSSIEGEISEDEEYDEERAAIVAQQIADLKDIVLSRRSRKFGGTKGESIKPQNEKKNMIPIEKTDSSTDVLKNEAEKLEENDTSALLFGKRKEISEIENEKQASITESKSEKHDDNCDLTEQNTKRISSDKGQKISEGCGSGLHLHSEIDSNLHLIRNSSGEEKSMCQIKLPDEISNSKKSSVVRNSFDLSVNELVNSTPDLLNNSKEVSGKEKKKRGRKRKSADTERISDDKLTNSADESLSSSEKIVNKKGNPGKGKIAKTGIPLKVKWTKKKPSEVQKNVEKQTEQENVIQQVEIKESFTQNLPENVLKVELEQSSASENEGQKKSDDQNDIEYKEKELQKLGKEMKRSYGRAGILVSEEKTDEVDSALRLENVLQSKKKGKESAERPPVSLDINEENKLVSLEQDNNEEEIGEASSQIDEKDNQLQAQLEPAEIDDSCHPQIDTIDIITKPNKKGKSKTAKTEKHHLRNLPSRGKQKHPTMISRRKRNLIINSNLDLLLDGNQNVLPNSRTLESFLTGVNVNGSPPPAHSPEMSEIRTEVAEESSQKIRHPSDNTVVYCVDQNSDISEHSTETVEHQENDDNKDLCTNTSYVEFVTPVENVFTKDYESVTQKEQGVIEGHEALFQSECKVTKDDESLQRDEHLITKNNELDIPDESVVSKGDDFIPQDEHLIRKNNELNQKYESVRLDESAVLTKNCESSSPYVPKASDCDESSQYFKILRLNKNPFFSDKKLVPVETAEEQIDNEDEELSSEFPKIIRYINDETELSERENGFVTPSLHNWEDMFPEMLALLKKNGNGSKDLTVAFEDIVVTEKSEDCFEIDYGLKECSSDFLALKQYLGGRNWKNYVCELCEEIFHGHLKFLDHKEHGNCAAHFPKTDTSYSKSPLSHLITDSVLDNDIDLSKQFVCNLCGLRYKLRKSLIRHKKTRHATEEESHKPGSEKSNIQNVSKKKTDNVSKLKKRIQNLNNTISKEKNCIEKLPSDDISDVQNSSVTEGEEQSSFVTIDNWELNSSSYMDMVQYIAEPVSDLEPDTTLVQSDINESVGHENLIDDSYQNVDNSTEVYPSEEDGDDNQEITGIEEDGMESDNLEEQMTPDQNGYEENVEDGSPRRTLQFTNEEPTSMSHIMTFSEMKRQFPYIFKEFNICLERIYIEDDILHVGNLMLKKTGKYRWKISCGESVLPTAESEENTPVIQTNDFDVNFPTYEIDYPVANSITDDYATSFSSQLDYNSDKSLKKETVQTKPKQSKEKKPQIQSLQSSPNKNLTDFEKAISKPKEIKKKRKLDRTPSKEDSNSRDGIDFFKKASERGSISQNDNYFMSSKIAQSILKKRAKESEEERLPIKPCTIEDIEPFETVLASKDKKNSGKKSPVKKKKQSENKKESVTMSMCEISDSHFTSDMNDGSDIGSMAREVIDSDTSLQDISSMSSFTVNATSTPLDDKLASKLKQKSLSDRFGAFNNSNQDRSIGLEISDTAVKDFKSMSSEEVMKSMFGSCLVKFDKKFRKQPGHEHEKDKNMSIKSPLESINRTVNVKFGNRPVTDLKQRVVIAADEKTPVSKKKHLLSMLRGMDCPTGKSLHGDISLTSPKDTGVFSDSQSYRTVIIDKGRDNDVRSIDTEASPHQGLFNNTSYLVKPISKQINSGMVSLSTEVLQKSNMSDNLSEKSNLSSRSKTDGQTISANLQKSNVLDNASLKSDLSACSKKSETKSISSSHSSSNMADITIKLQQTESSWVEKRNDNKISSENRTPLSEDMNMQDDNESDTSDKFKRVEEGSISSKHSNSTDHSFRRKCLSIESENTPRKRIKLSRLPIQEPQFRTEEESHSAVAHDLLQSARLKESQPDQLSIKTADSIEEMETEHDDNSVDLGTVDEQDSFGLYGEGQNENLTSELEPEKITSNECRNIIQKTMVDENLDLNIKINKDTEKVGRLDELQGDLSLLKINKDIEKVGRLNELEGNLSPISSVNTGEFDTVLNSDQDEKVDEKNKETRDNEREEQRESDSDSDKKSQSDDESIDESDSDEDSESSDSEVSSEEDSNESGEEKSEAEEGEDMFSTNTHKENAGSIRDYNAEDDAISIIDYDCETASFLIAPQEEEEERMTEVDTELNETGKCDSHEKELPPSDTAKQESHEADKNPAKRLPKSVVYPSGYCFVFLGGGICVNRKCQFKHHVPLPIDTYYACVKEINMAYQNHDVKRAFDVYHCLINTKVGLTPRDTLMKLLKVAEDNYKVELAFSLLDEMNSQDMITKEVCDVLFRLVGKKVEYYWEYLWRLFDMINKSKRDLLTPDSIGVLLRSFSSQEDLRYLWQVVIYAKSANFPTAANELQFMLLHRSMQNINLYYQYIDKWVQLCEPHLLQQLDENLRKSLIHLFQARRQQLCLKKLEESLKYANFQQQVDDSFDTSRLIEEGEVVLKDSIKTTDNYKALYHKIQSCYHTKNWTLLGETFVELCQQGELDNSYYIDAYGVVFLTNVKNSAVLVDAFNKFMLHLSRQYQQESQDDVLAKFDGRSISYIGNRLLYFCEDKKWWMDGHKIMKILIRYSVPFYQYSESGKPLSCITAINICLKVKDFGTAYNIHLHYGWEAQARMSLQQLKQEISILHELFDQLLTSTKPREALKVLGSCFDIIENNPELNEHFDFIEDLNRLIIGALECGDFHAGCWTFKVHSQANVSRDLDRRTIRALLTACGENNYLVEAKELYKICKAKSAYPMQSIEAPRTIHLTSVMTYVEIKLEVESYLEWVYRHLCDIQMDGNVLEVKHFFIRVQLEWISDPVAYKMPYLCRVPRTEMAANNMVLSLFLEEFGMGGRIEYENQKYYIYILWDHVRKYLEKLDAQGRRQGFRMRGAYNRPALKGL